MRKAEEIAKRYKSLIVVATEEEVVRIIKQIQLEAIDETVKMCAENVRINDDTFEGFFAEIDYNSILQVADKLKKELE